MERKIILSADATCDLNEELKKRYEVYYSPYHIILEGQDYIDNVDITADELYRAYWDKKVLPKTAAINTAEYVERFRPWVEAGFDVVHINLSHAISGSHQNCLAAAETLGHVYPVDSLNLSSASGLLVIEAAEMIREGIPAPEIQKRLQAMTSKVHGSFILDTLEFMHAGGRCSAVAALGANLLSLKPCIEVDNTTGKMGVARKYRGQLAKVLVKYTKDQLAAYENIRTKHIFITHSIIDPELVDLVRKTIQETMHFDEIHDTSASCTIASHCGPNTLGILFMTE
ncbi:DegV family protein [Yeguia hominis]|uniref:DegV family protein n=1 Tax=Yeguia hominis TaxID=2763662 RepID=A0A926HR44_9FIRM|nr:DegV family protein [Yeguia hominis]MBC8532415.1 DegV family protein [Yeguia hominis]